MRRQVYLGRLILSVVIAPVLGGAIYGLIFAALPWIVDVQAWSQLELIAPGVEGFVTMAMMGAIFGAGLGIPVGGIFAALAHWLTARKPVHGAVFGALAGMLAYTPLLLTELTLAWTMAIVAVISAVLGIGVAKISYRDPLPV